MNNRENEDAPDCDCDGDGDGNDVEDNAPQPAKAAQQADSIADLLADVERELRRYCVLPSEAAYVGVTLWAATTHVLGAFEYAPGLVIRSAEKRCGKSRVLEVLDAIVHNPVGATSYSVAALFRQVDVPRPPTLLLDEADGVFGPNGSGDASGLRTLINSSFHRGGSVQRASGKNWDTVKSYSTFAMICLSGIGRMPSTVEDRAVVIKMRRISPTERVDRFRSRRDRPRLKELGSRLAEWAEANAGFLEQLEIDLPVRDRAADTWEPLLAVAKAAGEGWVARATAACVELSADGNAGDFAPTRGERLLHDVAQVMANHPGSFLPTVQLLSGLTSIVESEWLDMQLTGHRLARMLGEFEIRPRHNSDRTVRGYARADFNDVFVRYGIAEPSDDLDTSGEVETDADS